MNALMNPARRSLLAVVAGVVVLVGLVAWVSSIGGPHGPGDGLGSVLYVWMRAGPPALAYLLGAIGLGSLFAPLWKGARDPLALQCGVGLAVMLSLSHGLGVLGLLAGMKGLVIGGGVVVLGLGLLARQVMRLTRDGVKGSLPWSVLLGLPGLALLLTAACSSPGWLWGGTRVDPVGEARGYDALEYHLELPQEWLREGRIWPRDWNVYSFLPGYVESAFTHLGVLMRVGPQGLVEGEGLGVVSCQMLVGLMGVLAAVLVGRVVRTWNVESGKWNGGVVAGLVGVLFLSTPWVLVTGSLAYNEMGMVCLMAAGMVAAGDRGLGGWRRGVLAGLLVGVACGCKPTALFLCGPVVGLILISRRGAEGAERKEEKKPQMAQMDPDGRKEKKPKMAQMDADGKEKGEEEWPRITRMDTDRRGEGNSIWVYLGHLWLPLVCACGAGLVAIVPWLVRNWVACGNPVFPMGASVFGSGSWSAEQVSRYRAGHGFSGMLMERVILLFSSDRGVAHGQWGVLGAVGMAGLVVGLVRRRTRGVAAVLGVGMVVQVLAWMFFTHLQSRFLMPVGVSWCVLVGVGLSGLLRGEGRDDVARGSAKGARHVFDQRNGIVVGAGAMVCVAQAGLSVGLYSAQGDGKPNLLMLQSPWVFTGELEKRALAADGSRAKQLAEEATPEVFVNVLVKPEAVVYLLGEARALYYTHPVLYNTTWDRWPLGEAMRRAPGKPGEWTRELWGRGVRLVLVNESEIQRLQQSGWADPVVTVEAVRGWLKDEGRLVRSWPGTGLYELKGPG